MNQQRFLFYFLSIAMIIIVSGCGSNKLTRPEAEKMIREKIQLPKDEFKELNTREIKKSGNYFKSQTEGNAPFYTGESQDFPKSELFTNLENNGLIKITTESEESQSTLTYYYDFRFDFKEYYVANFTEKALPFVNGNSVKVAVIEFGEVTGIVERKEVNISEVQYTTKRTNITPFGSILNVQEEIFNHTVTFTKYDDGWRINN